MLRGTFKPDAMAGERFFRWRGGDVSRLEGLADAIFALALTFLVIRLEVPETFPEVRDALIRAPVYVVCFALFLWVWYCHSQFHRRYGLEGPLTVAIDGAILFVVLMFALPLRFLADLLFDSIVYGFEGRPVVLGPDGVARFDAAGDSIDRFGAADPGLLMIFYAGGFALVFLLFALQTWNAYRRSDALELDELERLITRNMIRVHLASAAVGLLSVALSLSGVGGAAPGLVFFLMGPLHGLLGWRQGAAVERKAVEMGIIPSG